MKLTTAPRLVFALSAALVGLAIVAMRKAPETPALSEAAGLAMTVELTPPVECWFHNRFPQIGATIGNTAGLRAVRLYYRCSTFADTYFVDMQLEGGRHQGVAPMAEESCPSVFYYVEAIEEDFNSGRSEEREAEVSSDTECRRRDPRAAWFPGDDPQIIVGATREGAAAVPPGFKAAGIAGFVSPGAAAAAAASGGGGSGPIIIGAAAAGGGAGALLAVAGGGDETTTSSPAPAPPTTATTTSSTPAPGPTSTTTVTVPPGTGLTACFTTDPSPPVIKEGDPIRLDGRCSTPEIAITSYVWDLGDGRARDGALITPTYRDSGLYNVTLTVSDGLQSDSTSRQIRVEDVPTTTVYFQPRSRMGVRANFKSTLAAKSGNGAVVGIIMVNGNETTRLTSEAPFAYRMNGTIGDNKIRAYVVPSGSREGYWRFDFSGESNFVAGSIIVRRGDVLTVDAHTVAFRVSGEAAQFVEFDFELIP